MFPLGAHGGGSRIPKISPSAQWTGTSASGYGGINPAPTDPARGNGKPAMKLIDPDGTMIGGDTAAGRYIGVHMLSSNGAGGVGSAIVRCYVEGNVYTVPLTYRTWVSNYDGVTVVGAWAYWVHMDPAVWTGNGWADIYWEAVPADGIQSNKVIGPYKHGRQATLIGKTVTVTPSLPSSGDRYQTFTAARAAMRAAGAVNGEIVLTETANYEAPVEDFAYDGLEKGFCTVRVQTGQTATFTNALTPGTMRPKYTGLKFTGPNLKIDLGQYTTFTQEGSQRAMWFDGVELWNPDGRLDLNVGNFNEGFATTAYFTECYLHDNLWGMVGVSQLIRNTRISTIAGDATQYAPNIYGLTLNGINNDYYRTYRDALQVQYSGTGAGTLAKTGSNGSTSGTLVLVLNGVTTTILLDSFGKSVATVVSELNAISGITATALSGAAVFPAIYLVLESNGVGAFTAQDIKTSPLTLDTFCDVHGDIIQQTPNGGLIQNVIAWAVDGAQLNYFNNQTFQDIIVANYAACIDGNGSVGGLSQVCFTHNNVHQWHISILDQAFGLRTAAPQNYNPDTLCSFRNSVFEQLSFLTTADTDLKIDSIRALIATDLPAQATNAVTGGTANTLYTDVANGDWSIPTSSPLLSDLVARALPYNAYNAPRSALTTKGAV